MSLKFITQEIKKKTCYVINFRFLHSFILSSSHSFGLETKRRESHCTRNCEKILRYNTADINKIKFLKQ